MGDTRKNWIAELAFCAILGWSGSCCRGGGLGKRFFGGKLFCKYSKTRRTDIVPSVPKAVNIGLLHKYGHTRVFQGLASCLTSSCSQGFVFSQLVGEVMLHMAGLRGRLYVVRRGSSRRSLLARAGLEKNISR